MVSIDQIKELRERTGISMTVCKKALEEVGGDMNAAIDLLRKKGEAKAVERGDRDAGEGRVAIAGTDQKKAMILLACETDFVARSEECAKAAQGFAERVLVEGVDVDLSGEVADMGIQLGEKIEIKGKVIFEGPMIGAYIHSNNKIGVLVNLSGGSAEQGKDVAMHTAATKPDCVSPDQMDADLVEHEKGIWREQLVAEGKPAEIMDKIMMGKERKFGEDGALISQPFVKNPDQTVGQYLGDVVVNDFVLFQV